MHMKYKLSYNVQVLEKNIEKFAEARFHENIAGSIWFRWLGGDDTSDTIIYVDLYHVNNKKLRGTNYTEHYWKIYVSDIFDISKGIIFHTFIFLIHNLITYKS